MIKAGDKINTLINGKHYCCNTITKVDGDYIYIGEIKIPISETKKGKKQEEVESLFQEYLDSGQFWDDCKEWAKKIK
jgi:hypothetical protein